MTVIALTSCGIVNESLLLHCGGRGNWIDLWYIEIASNAGRFESVCLRIRIDREIDR